MEKYGNDNCTKDHYDIGPHQCHHHVGELTTVKMEPMEIKVEDVDENAIKKNRDTMDISTTGAACGSSALSQIQLPAPNPVLNEAGTQTDANEHTDYELVTADVIEDRKELRFFKHDEIHLRIFKNGRVVIVETHDTRDVEYPVLEPGLENNKIQLIGLGPSIVPLIMVLSIKRQLGVRGRRPVNEFDTYHFQFVKTKDCAEATKLIKSFKKQIPH